MSKGIIAFTKPLCYPHWKDFDAQTIFKCGRCHWFDEMVGEFTKDDLCMECLNREQRGFDPTPVYPHGPVERHIRYVYVLKLEGGNFYVGQTNDLKLRVGEHADGRTPFTRGKHPRLLWFEQWVGQRDELNQKEDAMTHIALNRPRALGRMMEDWQRPIRLVDLGA